MVIIVLFSSQNYTYDSRASWEKFSSYRKNGGNTLGKRLQYKNIASWRLIIARGGLLRICSSSTARRWFKMFTGERQWISNNGGPGTLITALMEENINTAAVTVTERSWNNVKSTIKYTQNSIACYLHVVNRKIKHETCFCAVDNTARQHIANVVTKNLTEIDV